MVRIGVGEVPSPDLGVGAEHLAPQPVRQLERRPQARKKAGERPLPAWQVVNDCRRGYDDQVGFRPVAEQIAEDDQSPERVTEQDNRLFLGHSSRGDHHVRHVSVVVAEQIDERAPACRPAEPAEVEGMDVETCSRELFPDVLVSPRMLGQPVDDQDHGPWIPSRLPVADQQRWSIGTVADAGRRGHTIEA